MFTLISDKSKYFRVKRGQTKKDLEEGLKIPVEGEVFAGRILFKEEEYDVYIVKPLETYSQIAEKLNVAETELKKINSFKPLYPTCKLFVPCKKSRVSI